ncbi:MAG: DNA polymerase III subunit alpha [Deltaproteobacteria bacterium]|nr:DNA polymerase III subunit alpha [Deltaproteobacteria bacterium]
MSFIHLNVHSDYSKGWGLGTIEELCRAATVLGIKRFALTDTNGLYGLVFFVQIAKEMGLEPIVGSELLHDGRRAVVIVKGWDGYANLCHIISARHCHDNFNLIRALREKRRGLIIFSDDFTLLKALKKDSIRDLFVEMSPGYQMGHCHAFSRKTGIPPLATNRVFMIRKDQFRLHRILRAVSLNTKLSRLTADDTCREHSFLNAPHDMIDQYPHAPTAISNTVKVAESSLLDWDFDRVVFPSFEALNPEEAFHRLYRATMDGCRKRYGRISHDVKARVAHEMRIIQEKRFASYFLVVADITKKGGLSCGRGSAAASIVSYALGITHVDPIQHRLFFERFLNPGRMDPPDIDVDFAWDERDQVIDNAFARYGNRRTAMVATHTTLGPRSAIREVAKVFGLTDREIGQVTDKIGFGWHLEASWQKLARHPKMRGIPFKRPWDEILTAAFQMQGHFNHLSTHCGGVVIVPDEIRRYCPVEISQGGLQVLQWEKDSVEETGLVKIDILGNRSLAVIRDALDLVEHNYGRRIDYARLNPVNDVETVRIFYEGNTFGVFYFESPATRQVLTKVKSGFTFDEYSALNHFLLNVVVTSIIRPGSNQSIHTWISRLHGEAWSPPHPLLGPVLKETLGVMVFQEQLSQAAIHLAGFDPAAADTLRKTVSKKHKEKRLRDFYAQFVRGASGKGVDREVIEEVWQMMTGFDGYSFCKPHSASYTLVAYKSAYLRAHYPAEFMASVISNHGGYYATLSYISEARRMGIEVMPPDINHSEIRYTGKDRHIRVGLMQLKDLSQEAKEAIIHERIKNGPFTSLEAFLYRTGPHLHLQDVRILIKGGCFDGIARGAARPGLIWKAIRFFARKEEKKTPGLFDSIKNPAPLFPIKRDCRAPYPRDVMLRHEAEIFGFILSAHPLTCYGDILKNLDYIKAKDLHSQIGREVTSIGWLVTGKTVHTNSGEPMKFITFEDTTAAYEAVFFPKVYRRFCHLLNAARPYILKGRVEEIFGAINITVSEMGFLDKAKPYI